MHLVQIGKAALGQGAQQVQSGRGMRVGRQQAGRVRLPRLRREHTAVDDVPAVRGQRLSLLRFHVGRPRLGELAGNASHLHHRAGGCIGEHDGHLQDHAEGGFNRLLAELVEALGAITALQQEGLAPGHGGEAFSQLRDFAGKYERWQAGETPLRLPQHMRIGIRRHLQRSAIPPGGWAPSLRVGHRWPPCPDD